MIPAGMFRNIGKGLATAGAARFLGNRTAIGAVAGGLYGAMSDDTSVLGGALMGAGAARYLGAGFRLAGRAKWAGTFGYGRVFGRGMINRAGLDWRGIKMMSNRGMNKIGSTLKGWR